MINLISLQQKILATNEQQARESFVRACEDLYRLYGRKYDSHLFNATSHPGFSAVLDNEIELIQAKINLAELIITVTLRDEFDPDYSHISTYLQNQYSVNGEMMDVCDIGILGIKTSLKLAQKFIRNNTYQAILILVFE